jgi:hypothetical protein
MLSDVEKIETARALGADYARYAMKLPEDAPRAVHEGYAASLHDRSRSQQADRFVRKWVQLRMGALRRDRRVDENVTPEHLRAIDSQRCPVTRVILTHGELTDTDWSVDRLNNDGGYAAGNLAVLSTRANQAKGTLGYPEVRRRFLLDEPTGGLTPAEWLRMASVMFGACHPHGGAREWLPLATWIPNRSTWSPEAAFQDVLIKASRTAAERERIASYLRPFSRDAASHERLKQVLKRLYRLAKDLPFAHDALLDDAVQAEVQQWYRAVRPPLEKVLVVMVRELHGGTRLDAQLRGRWSLDTRGYVG